MTITKIQFSKTVESSVLGAGVWVRIGVEGNLAEGENVSEAIEEARVIVQNAHEKNPPDKPIKLKPNMDIIMLRKYEQAIKDHDAKTISEIENNFNVVA